MKSRVRDKLQEGILSFIADVILCGFAYAIAGLVLFGIGILGVLGMLGFDVGALIAIAVLVVIALLMWSHFAD